MRSLVRERQHEVGVRAAIAEIAGKVGLTVRRLRGFLYDEASKIYAHEYVSIMRLYDELSEMQAQRLEARAALLRAQKRAANAAGEEGSA